MSNYVDIAKWRGWHDEVELDPASIEFKARQGAKCGLCAFNGQWARICDTANEEALKRGLKRCDDGVIYIRVEKDARQLDIVDSKI